MDTVSGRKSHSRTVTRNQGEEWLISRQPQLAGQNRWSKHSYDTENSRNATRETGSGHGIIAKPATI